MSAPTSKNQRWWGGEPVWITAMRQGQRTASMFWPGSEVIGRQPTYWRPFDDAVPNDQRVNQVLEWLALSADQRPSFVTLYFSEVDHAGHDHGPESQQVMDAAAQVDAAIGQLVAGITRSGLLERTTIVVVSDHGMSALSETRVVFLDDYVDLAKIDVIEWTPNLGVRPGGLPVDEVYLALRGKHPALAVYRREEVPAWLRYRDSDRIPPIIGLADDGWMITSRARFAATRAPQGGHGYDPRFVSMHGLFIAAGPRLRRGVIVPGFENLHVYNFLCELLGVRPAPNDGDATVTRGFFAVPNGVISTPRSWR
jgi:predicted AlkP superfamily pyrophosphatase or phosphodiesterase